MIPAKQKKEGKKGKTREDFGKISTYSNKFREET
jgi:hypothetical protein